MKANHDEWHRLGEEIVLERERKAAAADRASWEEWRAKNPGQNQWRGKPMTRRQYFLISRTADHLGIRMPGQMTRGEACDWLEAHGGNLRLSDEPPPVTPPNGGSGGNSAGLVNTCDELFPIASSAMTDDRDGADNRGPDPDMAHAPIGIHDTANADHDTNGPADDGDGDGAGAFR